MKWSVDCADAYALARTRHAVMEQLKELCGDADLFVVETVLGELLSAEMGRGHVALAVTIEPARDGPSIHIYTQGRHSNSTHGELREAILRNSRVPMSIEISPQGTHVALRAPR